MMIMTGCNVESGPDPDPPGDVADSILMFEKIKNNDKMLDDLQKSDTYFTGCVLFGF